MRPSKQHPKFSVSVSGSCSTKIMFLIPTNQFVSCGVISTENVILEDLVGSHFTLWIGTPPYHTFSISNEEEDKEGWKEGSIGIRIFQKWRWQPYMLMWKWQHGGVWKRDLARGPWQRRFLYENEENRKKMEGYQPTPILLEASKSRVHKGGRGGGGGEGL